MTGEAYVYDARHYLVLAVPLPFEIETEASPDEPMLGLALRIDQTMTAELALAMNYVPGAQRPARRRASCNDNPGWTVRAHR